MDIAITDRLAALDWGDLAARIDSDGHARTGPLLNADECAGLIGLFDQDERFRKTIEMSRYRYGEGQYRYFNNPLPGLVARLRQGLYRHLAPIANAMAGKLTAGASYPPELETFLGLCHDVGQTKPTPLLLRYAGGGYNRLHQDLYGTVHFPLQAVFLLSRPGKDFTGGEFLLLENQPRAQAIGQAIIPARGELLIIPVRERPVAGKRGYFRAPMRHGVSRVHSGHRHTLGVIFHDAE